LLGFYCWSVEQSKWVLINFMPDSGLKKPGRLDSINYLDESSLFEW